MKRASIAFWLVPVIGLLSVLCSAQDVAHTNQDHTGNPPPLVPAAIFVDGIIHEGIPGEFVGDPDEWSFIMTFGHDAFIFSSSAGGLIWLGGADSPLMACVEAANITCGKGRVCSLKVTGPPNESCEFECRNKVGDCPQPPPPPLPDDEDGPTLKEL